MRRAVPVPACKSVDLAPLSPNNRLVGAVHCRWKPAWFHRPASHSFSMRLSPLTFVFSVCLILASSGSRGFAQKPEPVEIDAPAELPRDTAAPVDSEVGVPEDLLQDEHLREEFGVNTFTAPSIKKLFGDLAELGVLPYEKVRRDLPKDAPRDRTQVALSLGMLWFCFRHE